MLPEFNEQGLLPPGIHRATFEEFEKRFVYFAISDRRHRIFERLRNLYEQVRKCSFVKRLLVAGSYVTTKAQPNDYDCILVLDPSIEGQELLPMEYNIVWRKRASRVFGGDVIPVFDGSVHYHRYMELFQSTRADERVGLVEIEL